MTSDEPLLHALSVEPRIGRAGDTIAAVFRTRNAGALASPPGTVTFILGEGLDAIGSGDVTVDPVAPGEEMTAIVRARIAAPCAESADIAVRAELRLGNRALATNECRVTVRSTPVFDGPASGTFVETIDSEHVRVRAVVTNEGDGPSGAVRITVPTPAGCARAGEIESIERASLSPGESAQIAFDARIASPVGEIVTTGAAVHARDARSIAIPVRQGLRLTPSLAPPDVQLVPSRRRVEIGVVVRNDGWTDAFGVRVGVALPAGLRPIDDALTVDGMPVSARCSPRGKLDEPIARAQREPDARTVVLACVPARTSVRVSLAAAHRADCAEGVIRVCAGDAAAAVPFAPLRVRDVRARIIDGPRSVVAGETIRLDARIENFGDVAEEIHCVVAGASSSAGAERTVRTIAAGTATTAGVTAAVPAGLRAGDVWRAALVVGAGAEQVTRVAIELPVHDDAIDDDDAAAPAPAAEDSPCAPDEGGSEFSVRLVLEAIAPRDASPIVAIPSDGDSVPPPVPSFAAGTPPDVPQLTLALDGTRIDEIGRMLHGLRAESLVGHLFTLRLFFPNECAQDAGVAALLATANAALRDVFDRLYVKLRIPGYGASADDLDDAALRAVTCALLDRLESDVAHAPPASAVVAAPLGAPAALRALVALVVAARCDDGMLLAGRIARHASLLAGVLARYDGMPLEIFDCALALRAEPALGESRDDLIAALQPHLTAAQVAS